MVCPCDASPEGTHSDSTKDVVGETHAEAAESFDIDLSALIWLAGQLRRDLASELVASVPHRLLLISVQTATVDSFDTSEERQLEVLDHKLIYMQRLATFYIWILSKETPEFVATVADTIMAALLRLLGISSAAVGAFLLAGVEPAAIPSRALRRDPLRSVSLVDEALQAFRKSAISCLRKCYKLAAAAFAQFALRLEMEELRSRLVKVLDWARSKQPKLLEQQRLRKAKDFESFDAAADAAAACRVMALTSTMSCIADAAPGIAEELLLPLGTKDVSSALVACRRFAVQIAGQRARKRRKTSEKDANPMEALQSHTWWWFDVACSCLDFIATACKSPSSAGTEAKTFADTAEELRDPVVNLLDIFEFLSEAFGTTTELRKALEAAVVALTNVASESGVKMLVQAILEKSRSEDAEVRLGAVRCVHRIWMDLGVQVVMCLSEVTMYASELLEDEDSRVEMAVRAMIKTMEDCTGESLQDTLKS
ncbi:utp10 [Symbiodinium pilosum]|uniref:HEAT repeat-containing protein 1 n=1 Tax=Symbiodinium pilosum TaxID=2952 RepID=A0A812NW76_SYMPI|nr:utp10 [Symbiodinium pilosum]